MEHETDEEEGGRRSNFIRDIIDADLASGKHDQVVTRFPPEPNGYLHIGHAKSICLNFGLGLDYAGATHLRFDDTNPTKEEQEYVDSIQADVRWLGFEWTGETRFASDYFETMVQVADKLIAEGLAYVDSLSREELREHRGAFDEPGTDSPYRTRSVAENQDLFRRMRAGEFPDGAHVLRAKIDMASPNMLMRDPLLYRILHAHHHRTGDAWCIYPMYDFAHCIEDAIEGVTHSICTLEFEENRALYDWVLDHSGLACHPQQIEFARLALEYTMMSKRKLLTLVEEGHVCGWDDPRMPTLAGFRRRGVRPEAIRRFCDMIGVAKANSMVDVAKLEYCVRDDLNHEAPRVMGVLEPLKLVVTTWPEGEVDWLDAPLWPYDVPKEGSRKVPFGRELWVEREDFLEKPPKGWRRLAPGREVRLRYGYLVTCDEVVRDAAGEVIELRCSHDPESRGGEAPDGRRVKGTVHWVSAEHAVAAEVRLYDRLFKVVRPGTDEAVDFRDELNPESLVVLKGAMVEPSLAGTEAGVRVQLERQGFFITDAVDSRPDGLVFNRIIGLKDSWAKQVEKAAPKAAAPARTEASRPARDKAEALVAPVSRKDDARDLARAADPSLAARFASYQSGHGLSESDADVLTGDAAVATLFDEAVAAGAKPASAANWVVNEVLRELKERSLAELPLTGEALGQLATLVDDGTISSTAAKEVFGELTTKGGDPRAIVAALGLAQVSDAEGLRPAIRKTLSDHPDEVARYRGGERRLIGFLIGQVMKASGGRANPQLTRELLLKQLEGGD